MALSKEGGTYSIRERENAMRSFRYQFPGYTPLFFNDLPQGFGIVREELNGYSFGLPQGKGPEKESNLQAHVLNKADFIVPAGVESWKEILSFLDIREDLQKKNKIIPAYLRPLAVVVSRSEARTEAAVLPVTDEMLIPVTVSLTELAEMGVTVRAEVRVAQEVTMGIVAPLFLAAMKTKAALHALLASVTGHTGAMSENLAKETRWIGRMVLGISQKVFETTDAFALGPQLLGRLMENNGAGVVAMRETFMGTNIAALADATSLEKINQILEKAGLEKFFTARELKKRLSVMKNPVIRAIVLSGEALSQDDLTLLQIADKNIIPMTQRMLDSFMRVMEDLVSQLLGDQAVLHSA